MLKIVNDPIQCESAKEFLDTLSPIGDVFRDSKLIEGWLFRGQGRDALLIPSLFRREQKENLNSLSSKYVEDYSQLLLAERDILLDFFNIADKRGLILPDDSQKIRSVLETLNSESGSMDISTGRLRTVDKLLSLAALAQHYGLPTRLLDWTRNSYIAAFFAAESAWIHRHKSNSNSRLVVWAFYFPILGKRSKIKQAVDPVRIITAPSASNPNLKAQQGVFTLLKPSVAKEASSNYLPMDSFLQELADETRPEDSDPKSLINVCKMQKFTLPVTEANELLYLLTRLYITHSVIYPGYHSIIEDMKMRRLWY